MKKSTCFIGNLKKLNNKKNYFCSNRIEINRQIIFIFPSGKPDLDERKYDASANPEEDAPQEMLLSI